MLYLLFKPVPKVKVSIEILRPDHVVVLELVVVIPIKGDALSCVNHQVRVHLIQSQMKVVLLSSSVDVRQAHIPIYNVVVVVLEEALP